MKSNVKTLKSVDGLPTTPANPGAPEAATQSSPRVGTTKPVGPEAAVPIEGPGGDSLTGGVGLPADKPKPARFDFAAANQAHLKSMSTMRGKNAGPVKKNPTRR